MNRTVVYIDGFNLYFGLKSKGWNRYYWLNLVKLSESLLKPDQQLEGTKYFTSQVTTPTDKRIRQRTYIEALETLNDIDIIYGKFQTNDVTCWNCGFVMPRPSEKMTDVNIAIQMLNDAFLDVFDTAILISGDSDLSAAISSIRSAFPSKRVIIAFPPNRFSYELGILANGHFTIGRKKFAESVFPDTIIKPDGFELKIPEKWK